MTQVDYGRTPKSPQTHHQPPSTNGNAPFKPVPPPKPKNYRPTMQGGGTNGHGQSPGQWDNGVRRSARASLGFGTNRVDLQDGSSPRNQNGFYCPPNSANYHQQQAQHGPPIHAYGHPNAGHQYSGAANAPMNGNGNHYGSQHQSPYSSNMNGGYNGNGMPYNGSQYMHRGQMYTGSFADPFLSLTQTPHFASAFPAGNMPPPQHPSLDLAGSREQRGSAFELYRKPQLGNVPVHHQNIRLVATSKRAPNRTILPTNE